MRLFARDLVLLHPPSVYDFRESRSFFGPISDVIPSTPVFEMYPLGLTTIAARLEQEGFNVRILNIAYRMLRNPDYDAEAEIARLDPMLFGIDLHWLPHAHGALELARIVKKHHPATPVVLGGLSSSYYHRELAERPEVDLVMRGDSTEEPMVRLMHALHRGEPLDDVPNLTWKRDGIVVENDLSHVPASLDGIALPNYLYVIRSVFKYGSLASVVPYLSWLDYPITALLTSRGCSLDCAVCGGSCASYRRICNRESPAFRSPDALVEDVRQIRRFSRAPIFLVHDLRHGGEEYAYGFLDRLAAAGGHDEMIFELFFPAGDDWFAAIRRAVPKYSLELTLESQDERLRRLNGKFPCSNAEIEATIESALRNGAGRIDVFFMVGIPHQTYDDAVGCVEYARHLLDRFGADGRLWFFVAPLAPFLDPGSPAFEDPDRFGYRLRRRTLEDHRRALTLPTWKHILNYDSTAMTREEIVAATYDATERLARLMAERGVITPEAAADLIERIEASRAAIAEIDGILALPDGPERDDRLARARQRLGDLRKQQAEPIKNALRWSPARFRSLPRLLLLGATLLASELRTFAARRIPLWLRRRSATGPASGATHAMYRSGAKIS